MSELLVAVIGGIIVLTVQGVFALTRQWRNRVRVGELSASKLFVVLRRLGYLGRGRSIRRSLRSAATEQAAAIESQYERDPMWQMGQLRLVRAVEPTTDDRPALEDVLSDPSLRGGLFVRGEPGAGKSSTASLTARNWSKSSLSLRIDLASYNSGSDLLDEVRQGYLSRAELEAGLALNEVAIIFDSFESLDEASRATFDTALKRITFRYPDVRFAVLSRPEAPPTKVLLQAAEYRIASLSDLDISEAIRRLGDDPDAVLQRMSDRIRELCASPLALRMALQSRDSDGNFTQNPSTLYNDFVDALLDEPGPDHHANEISSDAKRLLLGELASHCANRITSLDYPAAQTVLQPAMTELQSQYRLPSNVESIEVLRQLIADGILRTDKKNLKFVHYSVQEFLAADAIKVRMSQGQITVHQIADLAVHVEWRNSIVYLAGILDDATLLVDSLRFKDRVLAAECAQSAKTVDPELVDQCIVEALYEFKFGKMSFNYDLVFALMRIANLRSRDLPDRIIDEMDYWCTKYAARACNELRDIDSDSLCAVLASGGTTPQVQDAAWTLGVRGVQTAVPLLEKPLRTREPSLDRIAALALGKIGSKQSASLLLSTALDPTASEGLRSACFNSVGAIGAAECLPSIVDFIRSGRELDGRIRENAAWALIGLVDEFLRQNAEFQDLLIDQLSYGSPYARAMFVYLLGRFKVTRALPSLIEIAQDAEENPLVLEDTVFALGEFRDPTVTTAVRTLLGSTDNIVRARAVEAATKLPGFDWDDLLQFAAESEPSEIVRFSARSLLGIGGDSRKVEFETVPADMRRRR